MLLGGVRRKISVALSVVLCLVISDRAAPQPLPASAVKAPLPTRWVSPDGLPKPTHPSPHWPGPLRIASAVPSEWEVPPAGPNGRVAIVVHDSIYDAVNQAILEFTWDLAAYGYSAILYRYVSGTPESLKQYLAELYTQPDGLEGAILVGDIPHIIYEVMQSWDGGTSYEYDDFPCDVFYMDLDGHWLDVLSYKQVQAGNGKYDTRQGDLALEIWVGRIVTSRMPSLGSEASLIRIYLGKVHAFRTAANLTTKRAVVYDDDDWQGLATSDASAVESAMGLGAVTSISNPEGTTAADFKLNRLPVSTRWYLVRSHGYAGGHGFYRSNRSVFDYVYPSSYRSIDPPASFFSLFVCSGCDYTASDSLGATVAFNPQSGLFALGSTKTGGMYGDTYFYSPMSDGYCIGESFRRWFNTMQSGNPIAPQWFYGMVMLGDPTLRPDYPSIPLYYSLTMRAMPVGHGTAVPSPGSHMYPAGQTVPLTATPFTGYVFERWVGPVADPLSPATTLTLNVEATTTAYFIGQIAHTKGLVDGTATSISDKVVTLVDSSAFYIQEDDRSCGIRVERPGHILTPEARVNVTGTVRTSEVTGERYVEASSADLTGPTSVPRPLELSTRAIGGGDWRSSSGNVGQHGVAGATGLSNIGLYVQTWGTVTHVGDGFFYIDNASGIDDGSGHRGVKVLGPLPAPPGVDPTGRNACVTGVSSCFRIGGNLHRLIRAASVKVE